MANSHSHWARLKGWADRVESRALQQDWQPDGIDLIRDDSLRSDILRSMWPKRMWKRPPIVVAEADFLTRSEASEMLKSKSSPLPQVNLLVARGILQPCVRATDGSDGVTRASVEEEQAWRRTASGWKRLRRRIGGIVHWI